MAQSELMEELKLPTNTGEAPDLEIEIVDDTPQEDRGRKALTESAEPTEEELEEYSEKVKARIAKLNHATHDERREKERAQRERDEAVALAQQLFQERQNQNRYIANGEQVFAATAKERASLALNQAKRAYKDAYEAGDGDKMAEAQEAISRATMAQQDAERFRPTQSVQQNTGQVPTAPVYTQPTPQQAAPTPDEHAVTWAKKNTWFGHDSDAGREMTAFAYGVHDSLLAQGIDPVADATEYYTRINKRVREKFPEHQWGDAPQKQPSPTVVAAVTRTPRNTTKVVLNQSQISLAKRLGLSPEQYAKEVMKLQGAAR